jgi:hypothetical protein
MRNRRVGLYAAVALAVLLSGCGRQASGVTPSVGLEEELPLVHPSLVVKVSADKLRPTPAPAIGVMVDGRWYPKDKAPTVTATPAPEAPESGKGHLHIALSLANRSSSHVETVELKVTEVGQSTPAFTRTFAKSELVGSKLSVTATNLAPGSYEVYVAAKDETRVLRRDTGAATVEADKTAETKI